ncbi:MAG: hypothetical protein ACKN9T_05045 [Candidatus Methylumidiphilus sp.]
MTRRLPPLLLAALLAGPAQAEPPKQDAAVQQVLRKAQGAIRQLSEEKAKLEADLAALQKENADLKAGLDAKTAALDAAAKQAEQLTGDIKREKDAAAALLSAKAAVEGQLGEEKAKRQQLRGNMKDLAGKARLIQSDNQLLVEAVKEREQWIGQCSQKNANLAEAQAEVIRRYDEKDVWEALGDAEPLTGIARVQTENAAQDYQFKLDALKMTPFQAEVQVPGAKQDLAAPAEDADEPEDETPGPSAPAAPAATAEQ